MLAHWIHYHAHGTSLHKPIIRCSVEVFLEAMGGGGHLGAVPALVTLIIVPPHRLLQGQSSECHGTSA